MRAQCLKDPNQKSTRQVAFFQTRDDQYQDTATTRMKRKIDSSEGRYRYSKRLGTVEPVFGRIQQMGMTQFRHRGQRKVDAQ